MKKSYINLEPVFFLIMMKILLKSFKLWNVFPASFNDINM